MSARFRRRGEIVEAVRFDGTNAEECARVRFDGSCTTSLFATVARKLIGTWFVRCDEPGPFYYSDEDFRAQFEPVPLPEPATADGWVRVEDRVPPDGLSVLVLINGLVSTVLSWRANGAWWCITDYSRGLEGVTHWHALPPLPAPPVVEGGK